MNVRQIRAAIGQALEPLDIEIYDLVQRHPATLPAVMIYPVELPGDETYDSAFNLRFELLLLAASVDMEDGQETLDGWLSEGTITSISDLLSVDETLGGIVQSTLYVGMIPNSYTIINLTDGGTEYLSARCTIDILT